MTARPLRQPLSPEEPPRRTFIPTGSEGPAPRPTVIPGPRGSGIFSGWGVKL